MIEYIFFDLGNVLVHFDAAVACRNVANLVGCSERDAEDALYGSGLEVRYERGEFSDIEFADAIRQWLKVDFRTEDLLHEMSAMFTPNSDIEPLLEDLQRLNLTLGVLSNTCAAHWNWIQQQRWAVASGWFKHAVLSYEVGSMKPDESIYSVATRQAGVLSERIFFTDDREENIEGARRAGWQVSWFSGVSGLRGDLKKAGLAICG